MRILEVDFRGKLFLDADSGGGFDLESDFEGGIFLEADSGGGFFFGVRFWTM